MVPSAPQTCLLHVGARCGFGLGNAVGQQSPPKDDEGITCQTRTLAAPGAAATASELARGSRGPSAESFFERSFQRQPTRWKKAAISAAARSGSSRWGKCPTPG